MSSLFSIQERKSVQIFHMFCKLRRCYKYKTWHWGLLHYILVVRSVCKHEEHGCHFYYNGQWDWLMLRIFTKSIVYLESTTEESSFSVHKYFDLHNSYWMKPSTGNTVYSYVPPYWFKICLKTFNSLYPLCMKLLTFNHFHCDMRTSFSTCDHPCDVLRFPLKARRHFPKESYY